jgi:hypothetical protein
MTCLFIHHLLFEAPRKRLSTTEYYPNQRVTAWNVRRGVATVCDYPHPYWINEQDSLSKLYSEERWRPGDGILKGLMRSCQKKS